MSAAAIEEAVREILAPAFSSGRMYPFHDGAASQLSQDRVRQVEGEAQVLVREERRVAGFKEWCEARADL